MDVLIRKMTLADLDAAIAIDQISFSLPWPPHSFRFELEENPAARCWAADANGVVAAMMVGWLIVDELHVATIATLPNYRGRGIAKQMLIHALTAARAEGAICATLEVRETNEAAQNLYRGLGFVEDGRRKEYYKDNHEDAILMSLSDLTQWKTEK
ncbi:MAG: ribosomal protein S18-alanine N-acetyltransferase [Anaerolineales bacterium]|nr:ribosomal protein S18-alanine N-acetyltransferase [Anaerolineales bacterium]